MGEKRAALPKLKRRLAEVEAFDPVQAARDDTEARALVDRMDATLVQVFGPDTLDYDRYRVYSLYESHTMYPMGAPLEAVLQAYADGKSLASSKLKTAIGAIEEAIADSAGGQGPAAPPSLQGIDLHPTIQAAAGELFRDGHYANAVENACKALNALVQTASGVFGKDNTDLARTVFSRNSPVLLVNAGTDDVDRTEQEGVMHLFEGVFMALRTPRAHRLVDDDPEFAFEAIVFVSFLAKLLATAKRK